MNLRRADVELTYLRIVPQPKQYVPKDPNDLTAKELEVLKHIALKTTDIRGCIHRNTRTIEYRIRRICEKLQVRSREQAIIVALKRGLLKLEDFVYE